MSSRLLGLRMRAPAILLALTLSAGCLAPLPDDEASADPAVEPAMSPTAFRLTERLWLPPSAPMRPAVTEQTFVLESPAAALVATVHLGATAPVADGAASAMVELRDADGKVLTGVMMMPRGPRDATLEAKELTAGAYTLRFETTGASDGKGVGQYLDYVVDAS